MTECEKLIKEGFIKESFLKEEIRDNYLISHETKKEWAIYLDLLRYIIQMCNKYHLQYWVIGGTLLGAVRHKGFIPWDDDIDVCMPRADYDRLLSINPVLEPPYYFRTPNTDNNYYYSYICICNDNTTNIGFLGNSDCHKGLSVSIMPIDGVSRYKIIGQLRFALMKALSVVGHAYTYNINPSIITRTINKLLHLKCIQFDEKKLFKRVNKIARKVPWNKTDKVGLMIYSPYRYERNVFNKVDFRSTIYLPFENLNVAVPIGYDGILRAAFGEYMKFPPVGERKGRHGAVGRNADIPYAIYSEIEK